LFDWDVHERSFLVTQITINRLISSFNNFNRLSHSFITLLACYLS
jgi:hypothetical protein